MDEITVEPGFLPTVARLGMRADERTMRAVQRLADEALARQAAKGWDGESATILTDIIGLYACDRAVEPHQDLDGAKPGMRVYGLVLRSDGHRLHSRRLHAAGIVDGLALVAGDLYQIDPYDHHHTTVPEGTTGAQLIFYIDGSMPTGQTPLQDAEELLFCVTDDVALLEAGTPAAVAG